MIQRALMTMMAVFLLAGGLEAEVSQAYRDYFDGPAGHLLTKQDRAAWKRVATDEAAEAFIQLFWAKRDPNLATPTNELKQEFDRRVATADQSFGYPGIRGALSDRGRVLILFGPAREIHHIAPGSRKGEARFTETEVLGRSLISYSERSGAELWVYDRSSLPGETKEQELLVVFAEMQAGQEDYAFDRGHPKNVIAASLLGKAPSRYLAHPHLNEAPHHVDISATQPASNPAVAAEATPEQLAWFELEPSPWVEGARAIMREGLVPGPRHFLWVHLLLPRSAPDADLAVGRLRRAVTDDVTGTFAAPVTVTRLEVGAAYELSVPVPAGSWRLEVALAASERPLAVTSLAVETTNPGDAGTLFSPLYWGCEVRQETEMAPGDPFNVGGWRVHPRASGAFSPRDDLTYAGYVIQPDLDADGQPQIETVTELFLDGKRLLRTEPRPAAVSRVGDGLWMFGGAMPLARFTRPGRYQLRIELRQTTDGAQRAQDIPFTIVVEGQPGG